MKTWQVGLLATTAVLFTACGLGRADKAHAALSLDLAKDLTQPALLDTLFDPRTQKNGVTGQERRVIASSIDAIVRQLGEFRPEGPGDEGGTFQLVGVAAGNVSDWEFCHLTRMTVIRGAFAKAGAGRVRFIFCTKDGTRVLRSIDFGVSIDNPGGLKLLGVARAEVEAIIKGAAPSPG